MADTIEVVIEGSNLLSPALDEARQDVRALGDEVAAADGAVERAGLNLGNLGLIAGGVAVAGIGALGAGLAASVDFAGQASQTTRDLQAQLGLTAEEAAELGDVAVQVFADNWYGSVEEAGQAVKLIRQQLGDLSADELRQVAGGAAAIGDTFGAEAPEIIGAVKAIRDNFPGTTEAQALDLITSGFQRGLNSSGDFLESIGEYSTQFRQGGATAEQFFSVMQTGLGSGVLGTDKAADLFKEFVVRINDGSTSTRDSLKALGINADKVLKALANGTMKPIEAFGLVQEKLRSTNNQAVVMQAGVGLLGSQFEDLGASAVKNIDLSRTKMEDLTGATASLAVKYQNWGSLWEGFKRQSLVAIQPVGDLLLGLANKAMPLFKTMLDSVGGLLGGLREKVGPLLPLVDKLFAGGDLSAGGWARLEGALSGLFGETLGGLLTDATQGITKIGQTFEAVQPAIDMAMNLFSKGEISAAGWARLGDVLRDALGDDLGNLVTGLVGGFNDLLIIGGKIGETIGPAFSALTSGDFAGFGDTLAGLGEQIGPIFDGMITRASGWLAEALPPLAASAGEYISGLIGKITEALPGWTGALQGLQSKAITWVSDALPGLGANLGIYAGQLLGWVVKTAGDVVPKLGELGLQFVSWVGTDVLPKLPGVLEGIGKGVVGFVQGLVTTLGPEIGKVAERFTTWVDTEVTPKLPGVMDNIKATISTWVTGAATWVSGEVKKLGDQAVQGIIVGAQGASKALSGALSRIVQEALDAAKAWLGIRSPSRRAAAEIGQPLTAGAAMGALDAAPMLGSAMQEVADLALGKLGGLGKDARDRVLAAAESVSDLIRKQAGSEDLLRKLLPNPQDVAKARSQVEGLDAQLQDLYAQRAAAADRPVDAAELDKRITEVQAQRQAAAQGLADAQATSSALAGVAAEAQDKLAKALQTAQGMTDPAQAAEFYEMRQQQIASVAQLQEQLINAVSDTERESIQRQLDLVRQANALDVDRFYAQQKAASADALEKTAQELVSGALKASKEGVKSADFAGKVGQPISEDVGRGIKTGAPAATGAAQGLVAGLLATARGAISPSQQIGAGVSGALATGITQAGGEPPGALGGVMDGALGTGKGKIDAFRTGIGQPSMGALATGMTQAGATTAEGSPFKALDGVLSSTIGAVDLGATFGDGLGKPGMQKIGDAFGEEKNRNAMLIELEGALGSVLTDAQASMDAKAGALGSALARAIGGGLGEVGGGGGWGGGGGGGGGFDFPGFASGTRSAPGGVALVGEQGPELVDLPRGSRVHNNRDTRGILAGMAVPALSSPSERQAASRPEPREPIIVRLEIDERRAGPLRGLIRAEIDDEARSRTRRETARSRTGG